MAVSLHHILDFFGTPIPPRTLPRKGDLFDVPRAPRRVPLAFLAASPRVRLAAEAHDAPVGVEECPRLRMAPAAAALAERLMDAGLCTPHGDLSCSISRAREDAVFRRCTRGVPLRREVSFPAGVFMEAALDASAWWLRRNAADPTSAPLAVRIDNVLNSDVPLGKQEWFPNLQAAVIVGRHVELSGLAGCSELRELSIQRRATADDYACIPDYVRPGVLTALTLDSCAVQDVAWLARLPALTSLQLPGCSLVADLSPIGSLTGLTSLDLSTTVGSGDFHWLALCRHLRQLDLSGSDSFVELTPVRLLGSLEVLVARATGIESVRPLTAPLTAVERADSAAPDPGSPLPPVAHSLRRLVLGDSWLLDMSGVEELPQLTHLDVSETRVSGYEEYGSDSSTEIRGASTPATIERRSRLEELSLYAARGLEDISWVPGRFPALVALNISNCSEFDGDLEPLAALAGTLRVLCVRTCEAVTGLPRVLAKVLEELDVSCCAEFKVAAVLPQCVALRVLHAQSLSQLTSLAFAAGMSQLAELNVAACGKLKSLAGLEAVAGTLYVLDISDTGVRDLRATLMHCSKLTCFACNDCPLTHDSVKFVQQLNLPGP